MLAVYKKELRSYLTSMVGYVFIAFILLIMGIYFTAYNLQYASPDFGATLSSVTFLFLIITPVLTMRILAEEKKNRQMTREKCEIRKWKENNKYAGSL